MLQQNRPFRFNFNPSCLAEYSRRRLRHLVGCHETHSESVVRFKLGGHGWPASMKAVVGSVAVIALVASTIQVRAEDILLKCDENGGRQTVYWAINESRVIRNGTIDSTVTPSTIAITRYSISFEESVPSVKLKTVWQIDRTKGQYVRQMYVDNLMSGTPSTGSCEPDTRPAPKL
jgi:hypothetical protein